MMRFRGLLAGVVVLAALAVGLYYSNKQEAAKASKPPADEPPKIISINSTDINKIDLKKKDGTEIVLERNAGGELADHSSQGLSGGSGFRECTGHVGGRSDRGPRGGG